MKHDEPDRLRPHCQPHPRVRLRCLVSGCRSRSGSPRSSPTRGEPRADRPPGGAATLGPARAQLRRRAGRLPAGAEAGRRGVGGRAARGGPGDRAARPRGTPRGADAAAYPVAVGGGGRAGLQQRDACTVGGPRTSSDGVRAVRDGPGRGPARQAGPLVRAAARARRHPGRDEGAFGGARSWRRPPRPSSGSAWSMPWSLSTAGDLLEEPVLTVDLRFAPKPTRRAGRAATAARSAKSRTSGRARTSPDKPDTSR